MYMFFNEIINILISDCVKNVNIFTYIWLNNYRNLLYFIMMSFIYFKNNILLFCLKYFSIDSVIMSEYKKNNRYCLNKNNIYCLNI